MFARTGVSVEQGGLYQDPGSQIVKVARLWAGDRVVPSSLEHWGWVELVTIDGSAATGYAYLLTLRVPCGATRRHVHATTWRHGWDTAARLPLDSPSTPALTAGSPPALENAGAAGAERRRAAPSSGEGSVPTHERPLIKQLPRLGSAIST